MKTQQDMPEIELIPVGDDDVGKKEFVKIHFGKAMGRDASIAGVEVHSLVLHSNRGPIKFNVWLHERFGGLREGHYVQGQCDIGMFDLSKRTTYENLLNLYRDIDRVCGDIPMIICGN